MGLSNCSFIKINGQLLAAGCNRYGQLGLGDYEDRNSFTPVEPRLPVNIGNIKQVACGDNHTLILDTRGKLFATGLNETGQLGLGDGINRTSFTQVQLPDNIGTIEKVACGDNHTLILDTRGKLFATGLNSSRQLGLGDGINRTSFTQVESRFLPDNIGTINKVACGGYHTFILDNTGKLFATGFNGNGELGLGDGINRTSFTQVELPGNSGPIEQLACGRYHTFILDNTGKLFATGHNFFGQLGLGNYNNINSFRQVLLPYNIGTIAEVACGGNHTFIRYKSGRLFATGHHRFGQLGLGNYHPIKVFAFTPIQLPDNTGPIEQVACARCHTFIRYKSGQLFATGLNSFGQLGLGDNEDKKSFNHIPNSSLEDYYDQANSLKNKVINYINMHRSEDKINVNDHMLDNQQSEDLPKSKVPEDERLLLTLHLHTCIGHFSPNAIYT